MYFVPTRGRPHRLQQLLDACVDTDMSMPGLIVVDGADGGDYSGAQLPHNWRLEVAEERGDVGGRLDALLEEHPDEEFYSIINDDIVPETPRWDVLLADRIGDGWNFVYPNDCVQGEAMATQFLVGGELARSVGSLSLGFRHGKLDRAWMEIADALGRLVYCDNIRLRHEHFTTGAAPHDETYKKIFNGRSTVKTDGMRWHSWQDEKEGLFTRLRREVP